jgi:protein required for attachment to host cells
MKNTWVLVADSSRARIFFTANTRGPLREIETLTHPESRLHEQQLTTDLPGRTFDSFGQGRHTKDMEIDPKQHEALIFVKQIADRLDRAREERQLEQLIVVAAPALLGMIRKQLSSTTAALVTLEMDKNITLLNAKEIRQHLPPQLPQLE